MKSSHKIAFYLVNKNKIDVRLYDLMISSKNFNDIHNIIKSESPKWIGISATTPQINQAFKIAELAKNIYPDVHIALMLKF